MIGIKNQAGNNKIKFQKVCKNDWSKSHLFIKIKSSEKTLKGIKFIKFVILKFSTLKKSKFMKLKLKTQTEKKWNKL